MQEKHIPGLSIAVSMPGGTIEESYGLANVEYKQPVEKDSIFEIGSISKTFTAIGILMLQEEGKLSVNDRITKYFPQYPGWNEITLKHLLQHTSGIKELTETEPFKSNQGKDWTPQEVVAGIAREPLDFEPGQKAKYSNTGCIILGLVIEKVTGISYGLTFRRLELGMVVIIHEFGSPIGLDYSGLIIIEMDGRRQDLEKPQCSIPMPRGIVPGPLIDDH